MAINARFQNGESVQAFPINKLTKQEVFTDEPVGRYDVLHIDADGSVTFTFQDESTYTRQVVAGQDYGLTSDINRITTTNTVTIS